MDKNLKGDTIKLYDLLYLSAKNAIPLQNEQGAFPPGHNGVRFDPETPVRNTGHWLITMLKVYELTQETVFKESAEKALDYLLSSEARPMNATFWHRKKPQKDFCNGLMGQAYTVEALAEAYRVTGRTDAKTIADEVFLLHPFDNETGLWRRVAVDGSYLSADDTFNHQLWFAASGALLWKSGGNDEVKRRVTVFVDNLHRNMKLYNTRYKGLIKHPLLQNLSDSNDIISKAKKFVAEAKQIRKKETKHAIAYHMFNLYALSLLRLCYPDHSFWEHKKCKMVLQFMQSDQYRNIAEDPAFSIPHSPGGFETSFIERAFTLEVFYGKGKYLEEQERLVSEQFKKNFDFDKYMMNSATADPVTQSARIYKATRLPDLNITV
ncbi:MAG TPA: hypothetical protein VD757_02170 [Candidatus Nitrosocosmicus sp.]|nr:hypothetical protein [Candidatus Nitrosocosmicus sp.]